MRGCSQTAENDSQISFSFLQLFIYYFPWPTPPLPPPQCNHKSGLDLSGSFSFSYLISLYPSLSLFLHFHSSPNGEIIISFVRAARQTIKYQFQGEFSRRKVTYRLNWWHKLLAVLKHFLHMHRVKLRERTVQPWPTACQEQHDLHI